MKKVIFNKVKFTLDVNLDKGNYEFKFMNNAEGAADFRLDRIEFEYLGE